jgi:hypothetical protein
MHGALAHFSYYCSFMLFLLSRGAASISTLKAGVLHARHKLAILLFFVAPLY